MKEQPSTTGLFRVLSQSPTLDHALVGVDASTNFCRYIHVLLGASGLDIPTLAKQSFASKVFVYQIFKGVRNPGRNMLLCMAFALKLNLEQTQKLLALAQRGMLYPRIRRDVAIIFALQHRYTLTEVDEALVSIHEPPLLTPSE